MSVADNIKNLRQKAELSQAQLAAKVGIGQSVVAKYELGLKVPSIGTTMLLARVLDCTTDDIIIGKE